MLENQVEIIQKIASGDQASFAELYAYSSGYAYYCARRLLNSEDDIQDVLQESYLAALQALDWFDPQRDFKPWLGKIVHNKALDLLKKRRDLPAGDDLPEERDDDEAFLPATYLEQAEKRKELVDMVDALPQAQRTAIVLFYFDELAVAEIAAATGVSESTVKSNLFHGRKQIKKLVLAEESKGNKLYSVLALPVLTQIFRLEAEAAVAPAGLSKAVLAGVTGQFAAAGIAAGSGSAASGGLAVKLSLLSGGAKLAIAGVTAAAIFAGIGIPLFLRGQPEEPLLPEPEAIELVVEEPASEAEPVLPPEDPAADLPEPEEPEPEPAVSLPEPLAEPEPEPEPAAAPVAPGYNKTVLPGMPLPVYDGIVERMGAIDIFGRTGVTNTNDYGAMMGDSDWEELAGRIPEEYYVYKANCTSEDHIDRVLGFYRQELGNYAENRQDKSGYIEYQISGIYDGYYITGQIGTNPSVMTGTNIYLEGSRTPEGTVIAIEDYL